MQIDLGGGSLECTFLDLDYSRANLKVVDGVKKFFNGLMQDWLREMVAADHEQSCSCKLGPGYTQTMLQAVSRVQLTPSSYYVTKDRKVRHAIMDWWLRHPLTGAEGTTLWVDGAENRMQFNVDMVMSLIINYMFPWLADRHTTKGGPDRHRVDARRGEDARNLRGDRRLQMHRPRVPQGATGDVWPGHRPRRVPHRPVSIGDAADPLLGRQGRRRDDQSERTLRRVRRVE